MAIEKSELLRELFASRSLVRAAGAHNALSARLAELSGFDVVWASGFEISTSHCVADASILSMAELLEAARDMNDIIGCPVVADCDTGFGEVRNVVHMVKRYETTGIAGVCIEDKPFPKTNSFGQGQQLVSVDEFSAKIRAAKATQRHPAFVVIARTEAFIVGCGVDEALDRARAYVAAGADAVLVHSKSPSPYEVLGFAAAWDNRAPLVVVPTTYFGITAADLETAGIKMVIYANHGIRAAVRAMKETFTEILAAGGTTTVEPCIAEMKYLFDLQGMSAVSG